MNRDGGVTSHSALSPPRDVCQIRNPPEGMAGQSCPSPTLNNDHPTHGTQNTGNSNGHQLLQLIDRLYIYLVTQTMAEYNPDFWRLLPSSLRAAGCLVAKQCEASFTALRCNALTNIGAAESPGKAVCCLIGQPLPFPP